MNILFSIIAGILFADFASGFIHWVQDRYGKPSWLIVGNAVADAHNHHIYPRQFLNSTFLQRNSAAFVLVAIIAGILALFGWLNVFTLTALAVGAFSNEIHATTHRKPVAKWIRVLRFFGLFQSPEHHARHHRPAANTHYCVITNYLNRALDHMGFWKWLEFCLVIVSVLPNEPLREKAK